MDDALRARVEAWVAADPDPETADELQQLLTAGDEAELRRRFDRRLQFGTAGLRGELGGGPNRMNQMIVRMAATAIVEHVGGQPSFVIGYDARRNSDVFAEETARIVASAGGTATVIDGPAPTPVIAHHALATGADIGIVVTASHNPPLDNGYKVYLADGGQVVPPHDASIEALMRVDVPAPADAPAGIEHLTDEATNAYLDMLVREVGGDPIDDLTIAYTPLHGVGLATMRAAFTAAGLPELHVVAEQAEPDGTFPTVSFPNPEEPGALDLVLALADDVAAELVLANDPDADRLSAAVPTDDGWRVLRGDEIGVLLADEMMHRTSGPDRLVANTIVSSQLLGKMAAAAGVTHVETLTGFKWIARAADDRPERFVFGYEEALGYSVTPAVRDKDGITAAVVFVQLVARLRATGRTVLDRLDELAAAHGVHSTGQVVVRFDDDPDGASKAMAAVRASMPTEVGEVAVERAVDFEHSADFPPSDIIALYLADGSRVILRPSGTEPKLKVYLEVIEAVDGDGSKTAIPHARAEADARLSSVATAVEALLR